MPPATTLRIGASVLFIALRFDAALDTKAVVDRGFEQTAPEDARPPAGVGQEPTSVWEGGLGNW